MQKKRVRAKQDAFQTIAFIVLAVIICSYMVGISLLQKKYAFRNQHTSTICVGIC